MEPHKLLKLRQVINENLRVQSGGSDNIPYIDVANVIGDITSKHNHVIFGRRGCGKTLLLHYSAKLLPVEIKRIYLNCEDYKRHSFPNVLIEILDSLFIEIEKNLTGWFGKKKKLRQIITKIRLDFDKLKEREDDQVREIKEILSSTNSSGLAAGAKGGIEGVEAELSGHFGKEHKKEFEQKYNEHSIKIKELDIWLPRLKQNIRDFFSISTAVKSIFIHIDDFYHLMRADQALVADYIHRLCKDVPLYFKIATLRHASILYVDKSGQPIGIQERHDYQPINIDFTFDDLNKTIRQNKKIFEEFGKMSGISVEEMDSLFKGDGFGRLILAGGGVPRDCLSLFLEILESVQPPEGDGRIGKDEVRILSRSNFERRITELKQDSEGAEQNTLIKGIYAIRQFCIDKKSNIILIPESLLQTKDNIRELIFRLLDYRIIHSSTTALTHKSHPGTFHAFVIDIGCYAHMRVLEGKFTEIDLTDGQDKDLMRSSNIMDETMFASLWQSIPQDIEKGLQQQEAV